VTFEWDENKNRKNIRKHGVSFEEAMEVFGDHLSDMFEDIYSENERRFLTIGMSVKKRLLIVSHTEDEDKEKIRIISARELTKHEHRQYERYR
jgi:uncharacterized protein